MTISDKIRIYELSRDLNLENKDILDAAQKLSISVKSHSSSISAEDAKKIKNLISKKNSDKKILSINKPSIKKEDKSPLTPSMRAKPPKDNSNKKPLLIKPLNKPDSPKIISNQPKNLGKPNIVSNTKPKENLQNQNFKNKPSRNFIQDKKNAKINTNAPIKSQGGKPIQLIEKPKNFINDAKSNESTKNIHSVCR